ncbi:Ap2 domain containing protein [Musa troglodytarum]|uniref:Ap2 domain containing protein n=2 Tax=Musa troglodytarum TaxID=320322 RepID=A0A9E7HR98_9LILI|nr:Ap2 domain containing protein [Musa troglodytarum]
MLCRWQQQQQWREASGGCGDGCAGEGRHPVPRRPASAVGALRGGDSRPAVEGAAMAGHLRHRRAGRLRVRHRRPRDAGAEGPHQLPLSPQHGRAAASGAGCRG